MGRRPLRHKVPGQHAMCFERDNYSIYHMHRWRLVHVLRGSNNSIMFLHAGLAYGLYSLWNVHIALCRRSPDGLCIFHPCLQTHKVTIISHSNNVWHGLVDFVWPTFTPDVCPAYNLSSNPVFLDHWRGTLVGNALRMQKSWGVPCHPFGWSLPQWSHSDLSVCLGFEDHSSVEPNRTLK